MMTIDKILQKKSKDLWNLSPGESAYKALEMMADKDIGAILVYEKDELAGIFTERDYARKVILKGKSSKETTVGELMTTKVITVTPETSIDQCMALMKAAKCRHMPVMEKSKVVGMVTARDILNELIMQKDVTISDLEHYIYESHYTDISHNP